MENYWGVHCLFDCSECDAISIKNKEHIKKFIKELIKEIQMVPYGDPVIEYIETKDRSKAGITVFQLIETSSIVAHFVDITNDGYIDVFSCKDYDENVVKKIIEKYFFPKKIHINKILRTA